MVRQFPDTDNVALIMKTDKDNPKGISRRDALKRMGLFMVGTVALSMPSLASCSEDKKKRIILYFTATGNSLYVARQLADENTELFSIPQLVKEGKYEFEADEIGIVYPIYGQMPPNMVRGFLSKARLEAPYRFAVLTYGNGKMVATSLFDELTRKLGKPFHYVTSILMVDNFLPAFDMNEQIKIDKHIPESLARIQSDLKERKRWIEPSESPDFEPFRAFLAFRGLNIEEGYLLRSEKCFVVQEKSCIGCGVCTQVCPRGNYELTSQGVKTEGDCDFCFACIQNCPQKAIVFAKDSGYPVLAHGERNPNARFRNEHVSLWSIKESNRQ